MATSPKELAQLFVICFLLSSPFSSFRVDTRKNLKDKAARTTVSPLMDSFSGAPVDSQVDALLNDPASKEQLTALAEQMSKLSPGLKSGVDLQKQIESVIGEQEFQTKAELLAVEILEALRKEVSKGIADSQVPSEAASSKTVTTNLALQQAWVHASEVLGSWLQDPQMLAHVESLAQLVKDSPDDDVAKNKIGEQLDAMREILNKKLANMKVMAKELTVLVENPTQELTDAMEAKRSFPEVMGGLEKAMAEKETDIQGTMGKATQSSVLQEWSGEEDARKVSPLVKALTAAMVVSVAHGSTLGPNGASAVQFPGLGNASRPAIENALRLQGGARRGGAAANSPLQQQRETLERSARIAPTATDARHGLDTTQELAKHVRTLVKTQMTWPVAGALVYAVAPLVLDVLRNNCWKLLEAAWGVLQQWDAHHPVDSILPTLALALCGMLFSSYLMILSVTMGFLSTTLFMVPVGAPWAPLKLGDYGPKEAAIAAAFGAVWGVMGEAVWHFISSLLKKLTPSHPQGKTTPAEKEEGRRPAK